MFAASTYFAAEGRSYSATAGTFVVLAVLLTLATLAALVQALRGRLSSVWPALLAILSTPAILFLAVIVALSDH